MRDNPPNKPATADPISENFFMKENINPITAIRKAIEAKGSGETVSVLVLLNSVCEFGIPDKPLFKLFVLIVVPVINSKPVIEAIFCC